MYGVSSKFHCQTVFEGLRTAACVSVHGKNATFLGSTVRINGTQPEICHTIFAIRNPSSPPMPKRTSLRLQLPVVMTAKNDVVSCRGFLSVQCRYIRNRLPVRLASFHSVRGDERQARSLAAARRMGTYYVRKSPTATAVLGASLTAPLLPFSLKLPSLRHGQCLACGEMSKKSKFDIQLFSRGSVSVVPFVSSRK